MNENWGDVRQQLDAVLASERAQRQARRQQRASLWQIIRRWCLQTIEQTKGPYGLSPSDWATGQRKYHK